MEESNWPELRGPKSSVAALCPAERLGVPSDRSPRPAAFFDNWNESEGKSNGSFAGGLRLLMAGSAPVLFSAQETRTELEISIQP